MKNSYFKKADIVLFVILIAIGISGFVLLRGTAGTNATVDISVSGEIVKSVPLFKDGEYEIKSDYGYNTICVEDGQVWVKDADCPNKDCMDFGKIKSEGQIILCLPHKLSVQISNADEKGEAVDAVSY